MSRSERRSQVKAIAAMPLGWPPLKQIQSSCGSLAELVHHRGLGQGSVFLIISFVIMWPLLVARGPIWKAAGPNRRVSLSTSNRKAYPVPIDVEISAVNERRPLCSSSSTPAIAINNNGGLFFSRQLAQIELILTRVKFAAFALLSRYGTLIALFMCPSAYSLATRASIAIAPLPIAFTASSVVMSFAPVTPLAYPRRQRGVGGKKGAKERCWIALDIVFELEMGIGVTWPSLPKLSRDLIIILGGIDGQRPERAS